MKYNHSISIIMELRSKTPIRSKYEPDRHSTRTLPLEMQHKDRRIIVGLSAEFTTMLFLDKGQSY